MLMQKERNDIVEYGKKMSISGLSKGTAGNISIYDPETGYMAISPSGLNYDAVQPEDVVVCDLDCNIIDGTRKPSSECGMHAGFYRAKAADGCHAIVHTHSDYATTLACVGEPIRAVHYLIATIGTDLIPVVPYTTFGTHELAEMAVEYCKEGQAVLLGNHGVVAFGPTIEKAFKNSVNVEILAKTQWQCMCVGKMNVLSRKQIEDVMERFKTYGQGAKSDGKSY